VRITTMMSVAILGLSTAALANMTTAPGQSTTNNIIANNTTAETPMANDMPMNNTAATPINPAPNSIAPR
jgi:hypothetical protein